MGEQITYTTSAGSALRIDVDGSVKYLDGSNIDTWQVEASWEQAYDTAVLQGYGSRRRAFGLRFSVEGTAYDSVRGTLAALRRHMMYDVARDEAGTVQVVLDNGGTYTVKAAPVAPSIDGPGNTYAEVVLNFEASSPWWEYGAQVEGTTACNGTTPVNLVYSLSNSDFKVWPEYQITGVAGTLTITDNETGDYIQIGTVTANIDDVLRIYTDPPEVLYYEHGAGDGVAWTGYGGTVSDFFALLPPDGSVQLTCSAGGTALVSMFYTERVGGLGI